LVSTQGLARGRGLGLVAEGLAAVALVGPLVARVEEEGRDRVLDGGEPRRERVGEALHLAALDAVERGPGGVVRAVREAPPRRRGRRRRRRGRGLARSAALATPCDDASLAAGKARCRAALAACFPPDGGAHAALCEPRCSNGRVLVDRGGRTRAPLDDGAGAGGSPRLYAAFLVLFYAAFFYFDRLRKRGDAPARGHRKEAHRRD
jgi:hypothetical protein